MRIPLALAGCLLFTSGALSAEEFPGNPLAAYPQAYWHQVFMQYTNDTEAGEWTLHTGLDVAAPSGTQVNAPIRDGQTYIVVSNTGAPYVILAAATGVNNGQLVNPRTQDGHFPLLQIDHIISTLPHLATVSSPSTVVGTIAPQWDHIHLMIHYCDDRTLSDYLNVTLVNPATRAFSNASWRNDSSKPIVESTVCQQGGGQNMSCDDAICISGQTIAFKVKAYDKNNSIESHEHNAGLYRLELRINGETVDGISFDRWLSRAGSGLPNYTEFYDGNPPVYPNNPNTLVYKLFWTPLFCDPQVDYQWSIWTWDAANNVRDPFSDQTVSAIAEFGASYHENEVEVVWRMNSVRDVEHFNVLRGNEAEGQMTRINSKAIEARNGGKDILEYRFVGAVASDEPWYQLEVIGASGGWRSAAVPVFETLVPVTEGIRLQPSPNPMEKTVDLVINGIGDVEMVHVKIYDLNGRLVRDLGKQRTNGGTAKIMWDGRTLSGERVGSGVYVAEARANERRALKKLVVTK